MDNLTLLATSPAVQAAAEQFLFAANPGDAAPYTLDWRAFAARRAAMTPEEIERRREKRIAYCRAWHAARRKSQNGRDEVNMKRRLSLC